MKAMWPTTACQGRRKEGMDGEGTTEQYEVYKHYKHYSSVLIKVRYKCHKVVIEVVIETEIN